MDPLVDYKKNTDYKKYENTISKHIKSLDLYDANQSTKMFGVHFTIYTGIYVIISNKEYNNYENIKFLRNGQDFSFIKPIIDKIANENNFSKYKIEKFNKSLINFIPINRMSGENVERHKPTNAIKEWTKPYINAEDYIYDKKHKSGVTNGNIERDLCIVFNTYNEAKNCFDSFTKSKFTRFYMSFITTDINIFQQCMPWMNDYKTKWDDERFYEYFNISDKNIQLIETYYNNILKRLEQKP